MNQTKKRLAIIKLAISMTDTETIQLQVLKLGLLKTDSRMREILETLNEQNYARAQRLISSYIDSDNETKVVQRTSQDTNLFTSNEEKLEDNMAEAMIERKDETGTKVQHEGFLSVKEKIQQVKNQAIIDQFQLFTQDSNDNEEIYQEAESYDNFVDISSKPKKMSNEAINYDALLNVDAEDVLPDNITLDIEKTDKTEYVHQEEEITTAIPKDNFFIEDESIQEDFTNTLDLDIEDTDSHQVTIEKSTIDEESNVSNNEKKDVNYEAISYIEQKFKNMQNQYPPIETNNEHYDKVDTLLLKIAKEGYSEVEIEELIKYIDKISQSDKVEAAQLLLIASSTESKYAQFRLARGLYKGKLLQKNLDESFTLIHRLAMNDSYPEAICDLGQFYENGIGVSKDKKQAEELYKEAMDLGIHRAIEHYERIRKENKGLFSIFKR